MHTNSPDKHKQNIAALTIAAIGVVFGDIGTSPIYTIREVFSPRYGIAPSPDNILGCLSLIFWALALIVSIKYVFFMLRADNRGEGGMMALLALVLRATEKKPKKRFFLIALGLFGAALFYGDGIITPAISVLSAVEGLGVATPTLQPYVMPITIVIVILLFMLQQRGSGGVGALFGPVTVIWFGVLGFLGLINLGLDISIFKALNPVYAAQFFITNKIFGFLAIGAIALAVTGTEGIYTDMGHFGRKPIRIAWTLWVWPNLLLNYFGQGALILAQPETIAHPFYNMVPAWGLYPLIGMTTIATVVASQAVISGTYSLTRQAIQLGYCPRLDVFHTSESEIGQIYMPWINWMLLAAVLLLILTFGSSSNLAGAYGVAVTGMMAIDTVMAYFVVTHLWGWRRWYALPIAIVFLTLDLILFSANSIKILHGGWFPFTIGLILFTLAPDALELEPFLKGLAAYPPQRVSGTAVFMTTSSDTVPHALLHNLNHNKVLHERIVLLTVSTEEIPHVSSKERVAVESVTNEFHKILVRYGFKDQPDIPSALELCAPFGLKFNTMETSYFLSRQTLVPKLGKDMSLWREKLFALMSRNSTSAISFFKLPANRVVELGTRIEL
ncbi:MAG: potassium transporter Kup [Betaproteobacteria bacterium]|nr:potassium transporter Kup [Betaproteobacteria bacterium]